SAHELPGHEAGEDNEGLAGNVVTSTTTGSSNRNGSWSNGTGSGRILCLWSRLDDRRCRGWLDDRRCRGWGRRTWRTWRTRTRCWHHRGRRSLHGRLRIRCDRSRGVGSWRSSLGARGLRHRGRPVSASGAAGLVPVLAVRVVVAMVRGGGRRVRVMCVVVAVRCRAVGTVRGPPTMVTILVGSCLRASEYTSQDDSGGESHDERRLVRGLGKASDGRLTRRRTGSAMSWHSDHIYRTELAPFFYRNQSSVWTED
ncbi:hypothetical protein Micbo1qcDRAFT_226018, partial [Microdochium bolleyi]